MGRRRGTALCVLVMAAVILAMDILFLKHRFWERLAANVGIVLAFGALYFKFLGRS